MLCSIYAICFIIPEKPERGEDNFKYYNKFWKILEDSETLPLTSDWRAYCQITVLQPITEFCRQPIQDSGSPVHSPWNTRVAKRSQYRFFF